MLVYEYMEEGSLADRLFTKVQVLCLRTLHLCNVAFTGSPSTELDRALQDLEGCMSRAGMAS